MNNQFERLVPLYGADALETLKNKTVAVIGLGGVGAYAVEGLIRMGVGTLVLMDADVVQPNNLNRLIIATHDSVGQNKTELLQARALAINPSARVHIHTKRFTEATQSELFDYPLDFIYDAIDSLKDKVTLIESALEKGIPFLSTTGQGNRWNLENVCIKDLFDTQYDPLARKLRKQLRDKGITRGVSVVHSSEPPLSGASLDFIASNPFVPATAGLRAAQHICSKLMEE